MAARQLFDDKEVNKTVIKELRNYRALKVKMINKEELEKVGIDNLFPILKSSEKVDEEDILKVKHIERALNVSLDNTERKIIEMKYLDPLEKTDIEIFLELGLKKGKYYDKKNRAISQIAKSIGIL